MRAASAAGLEEVTKCWNGLAALRAQQLNSGIDISWEAVLVPVLESLLVDADVTRVLDVGCGTGHLADRMSARCGAIVAVDLSGASIELAKRQFGNVANVEFHVMAMDRVRSLGSFTAAYANMSLNDTPTLREDLTAIAATLSRNSVFAFTAPHPCFWPQYWGYADEPWFDYSKEIAISGPFRITNDQQSVLESLHFHRPLSAYFGALRGAGFSLECFLEPEPSAELPSEYRSRWNYPRFIAVGCRRL